MSGRKLVLPSYKAISAQLVAGNVVQPTPTSVKFLDNVCVQGIFTGTPLGNLYIQASLNYDPRTGLGDWNDTSFFAPVAAAGSFMINVGSQSIVFPWLRLKWYSTQTGVQTVAPVADTGRAQVQVITAVADVAGSLNSTWFSISSVNATSKAQKNFYVWFDNGSGIDPAIAGKTGIHVTYTNNASATTIGGAMATALAALSNDFASASNSSGAVTVTNAKPGAVPAAADGTAATGFTFAVPSTPGVNSNLNNKYFLLQAGNSGISYYVWFNVAGLGTDPVVAGKTAIPVAISASASAGTVGSTMATAIAAADGAADFTASGTTTVTVTNLQAGPFIPAVDSSSPTGFTFAVTTGNGSFDAYLSGKMV